MRKTQVALAALALVASTAVFAEVKISGCMDVAVVNDSTGTIVGGQGDGCASQWSLRASEEVGDMRAGINLAQGLNLSSGNVGNGGKGGSGAMFNREANVFIGTEQATITIGTQLNPWIGGALTGGTGLSGVNVPMLNILNPNLGAVGQAGGGFFLGGVGVSGATNGVSYSVFSTVDEPSYTAGAQGTGTTADTVTSSKDRVMAANIGTSVGSVNVNFAYESHTNLASSTAANQVDYRNIALSANTKIAGVGLTAIITDQQQQAGRTGGTVFGVGGASLSGTAFGANYALSDAMTAGIMYAKNDVANAEGKMLAAYGNYALSGRTSVYAIISNFKNAYLINNAGNAGSYTTAKNTDLISVGIQHSF
jgi:hypothetical protein